MNGFERRWRANHEAYFFDFVLFAEDQWVVRNLPRGAEIGEDDTIRFTDFQKLILREVTRRNPDGTFVYDEWIYSTVKKSGKTEVAAALAFWLAVVEPGLPELYMIGNDKDQSRTRAFGAMRQQIVPERSTGQPRNPFLADMFRPLRDSIETADGGVIKTVAVDFAGEAGANPTASLWDELWGVDRETQRRLWDEFTPVPTRLNSIRVVTTYAGFFGESELLWELYERIVGGDKPEQRELRRLFKGTRIPLFVSEDGGSIAYWDDGAEAHRMPWQTPEYYARERGRLREGTYKRLHENLWVTQETAFITPEQYDALPTYQRGTAPAGIPEYIGVDAAHKRDTTSTVSYGYEPVSGPDTKKAIYRLIDHGIWTPTPGNVVIPEETAEPWIRERIRVGNVKGIAYDPAHFETPAARLKRDFPDLEIRQYTQHTGNLTKLGSVLFDAVRYVDILTYEAPEVREQFLNATAIDTGVGFRLVKGSNATKKIDITIASGEALVLAQELGPNDSEHRTPMLIGLGGDYDDD